MEIYNAARDKVITSMNIGKAWKSVGLELWDLELVLKQLPKRPSIQPTIPLLNITQKGPTGKSIEVPNIPANVVQVDELFKTIIGQIHLDPAIVLKIQKLRKGTCKAIANASIQWTANVDLITAELTKKK